MKKISLLIILFCFAKYSFSQDNNKNEFKPSGKLWGLTFGDYYYKIHSDSMNRGNAQYSKLPINNNAFDLRRVYLGYDYAMSEKFSGEFLLSYEGQMLSDSATRTVYVKAANVKWKSICHNTDLIIGLASTPTFALVTDKVWGYRSIEKSLSDFRGVAKAVDAGISLQGRLDSAGNFGYNLMAANGAGQKIETDRFKKFYGDFYAKFLGQKLILDLYADYERSQLSPYHKSKMAIKFFAAYQTEKFAVGAEVFQQAFENNSTYMGPAPLNLPERADAVILGGSVFVKGNIKPDKLALFVRADFYDPDSKFNADLTYIGYSSYNTELFATAGIDLMPIKNVHLIPNVWYNAYQNRVKNVSGKKKGDYDLVPRLTFYYLLK